jgi:hypothetical protein
MMETAIQNKNTIINVLLIIIVFSRLFNDTRSYINQQKPHALLV